MIFFFIVFFFSSRRRHTRFSRDWSSDVCSSDLEIVHPVEPAKGIRARFERGIEQQLPGPERRTEQRSDRGDGGELCRVARSEERRVGKECRSRWTRQDEKKCKEGDSKGELMR